MMAGERRCCATKWFLRKTLGYLVEKHHNAIMMGRYISKKDLYTNLNRWYRFSREETKELLNLMAMEIPGVVFSRMGMWVSPDYLRQPAERPAVFYERQTTLHGLPALPIKSP